MGRKKKKPTSSNTRNKQKKISRKEYKNTVKKNKEYLRKYAKISLYPESFLREQGIDKKAVSIIEKNNKQAINNINEARVKRGKKES